MINDENFKTALDFVFKSEGGFSDRKSDRGGRTNFGITQSTYNGYRRKRGLPYKDVKGITREEAKNIYYEDFWKASGAHNTDNRAMAITLFDTAVLHGVENAKILNKKSGNNVDKLLDLRLQAYQNDVNKHPDQGEYLQGWQNRVKNLRKNINSINIVPKQQREIYKNILGTPIHYDINKNLPRFATGFAVPIEQTTPHQVSFTPEQIGKMSREEFDKNESAIMHQLQTGGLNQEPSRDFGGYRNSHTGDNRIYTAEDIGNFSSSEFSHHEPAINAQMNSIGIPTNNDMQNSGGTVYIAPYTRSDGVEVRGHYRSRG